MASQRRHSLDSYSGDPVRMSRTGGLFMRERTPAAGDGDAEEFYEIEQASSPSVCPPKWRYKVINPVLY